MSQVHDVAILGASGYTGAELVRLIATHPGMRVAALAADRKAGQTMGAVFPHLRHLDLPTLTRIDAIDFGGLDLCFCALPHATSQAVIAALPRTLKIVDLSADFRLRDPAVYEQWYGNPHAALELQAEAVYGLTEFYRDEIKAARLVAGTGCNAATGMYGLLPLLKAGVVDPDDIVIDLATGVSGAGRSPKEGSLHAEVSEGYHAYNVTKHRHLAEFDQEFSKAAGRTVEVTFVPHLLPQNRGILATIYVRGDAQAIHATLVEAYGAEPFLVVLPFGEAPATRHVRGSNFVHLGVVPDRRPGRVMVFSTLDNLAKGSSGQALQNANLMLGLPETMGLMAAPLFSVKRTKRFLHALWVAFDRFNRNDGSPMAGYIAFSGILSIFPFLIFAATLTGILFGGVQSDAIIESIFDIAPEHVAQTLEPVVVEVLGKQSGEVLTIAFLFAIWVASSAVEAFRIAFDRAYAVPDPRGVIENRLMAILIVFIGGIVAALLGVSIVFSPLILRILENVFLFRVPVVASYLTYAFGVLVFIGFLLIMHRLLPARRVKRVWPGVLVTTVIWVAAASGFSLYLTFTPTYTVTYGTLAGVIITLMFFYLTGATIIYGAEVNAALNRIGFDPPQQPKQQPKQARKQPAKR